MWSSMQRTPKSNVWQALSLNRIQTFKPVSCLSKFGPIKSLFGGVPFFFFVIYEHLYTLCAETSFPSGLEINQQLWMFFHFSDISRQIVIIVYAVSFTCMSDHHGHCYKNLMYLHASCFVPLSSFIRSCFFFPTKQTSSTNNVLYSTAVKLVFLLNYLFNLYIQREPNYNLNSLIVLVTLNLT